MIVNTENDDETFIPVVLLKFGEHEHLMKFLLDGTLRVSSINDIRKTENEKEKDNFRNDSLEGITHYTSVGPTELTLVPISGKPSFKLPVQNITYYGQYEEIYGNISSFYGITDKCFHQGLLLPVDKKMKLFGDHFIIIKNFDEFVRRIDIAIENSTRYSWQYGFVKYFDEKNFRGTIDPFKKRNIYSYQKEFRLHFKTGQSKPIFINIGPLYDIAQIFPTTALDNFKMEANFETNFAKISFA